MVARAPGNISGEATTQHGHITYEAMRQHPVYIKIPAVTPRDGSRSLMTLMLK